MAAEETPAQASPVPESIPISILRDGDMVTVSLTLLPDTTDHTAVTRWLGDDHQAQLFALSGRELLTFSTLPDSSLLVTISVPAEQLLEVAAILQGTSGSLRFAAPEVITVCLAGILRSLATREP